MIGVIANAIWLFILMIILIGITIGIITKQRERSEQDQS
jgi:hypothetical protein